MRRWRGCRMTRTRASHGSVVAFDHTFSAPKSVSLLYAFGDDRVRAAVREAHQVAVSEAVGFTEARCAQARVGTHVVVINRVGTDDGWRALDARRNYSFAKAGGTVYEAALRDELTRRLG